MRSLQSIKTNYSDIENLTIVTLTDRLWRRLNEFRLCAGRAGNCGSLPPVAELSYWLRLSPEEIKDALVGLESAGLTEQTGGGWRLVGFEQEQAPVSSKTRVRQFRAREARQVGWQG